MDDFPDLFHPSLRGVTVAAASSSSSSPSLSASLSALSIGSPPSPPPPRPPPPRVDKGEIKRDQSSSSSSSSRHQPPKDRRVLFSDDCNIVMPTVYTEVAISVIRALAKELRLNSSSSGVVTIDEALMARALARMEH